MEIKINRLRDEKANESRELQKMQSQQKKHEQEINKHIHEKN